MTTEEARELREHRCGFGALQGLFFVFAATTLIPAFWHIPLWLTLIAMIAGSAVGGVRGWQQPVVSEPPKPVGEKTS